MRMCMYTSLSMRWRFSCRVRWPEALLGLSTSTSRCDLFGLCSQRKINSVTGVAGAAVAFNSRFNLIRRSAKRQQKRLTQSPGHRERLRRRFFDCFLARAVSGPDTAARAGFIAKLTFCTARLHLKRKRELGWKRLMRETPKWNWETQQS